ncbi:MAG TPA: hypothetical protein VGR81_02560 [Candidatus Acidoferrales bacterium]|nr:hypothetical protein [Candidatus Acidoferrales bacterium]
MSAPVSASMDNAAIKKKIGSTIAEVCESLVGRLAIRPVAVVLTGSFARDEGSVLATSDRFCILGDMEYMVVFPVRVDRAPLQAFLDQQAKELKIELASRGVDCDLEFRAITPEYFHGLRPQIFGYELLTHGQTVWGDSSLLSAVPRFSREAIPQSDAWRMLNNRIIEQLEWADGIAAYDRDKLVHLHYQLIKCHIDLATTLLVFTGNYESTYAARSKALAKWASEAGSKPGLEFLRPLMEKVSACTAYKLDPHATPNPLGVNANTGDAETFSNELARALTDLVPLVREIWRWEATTFSGTKNAMDATDSALQEAVLRNQPLGEKSRGWAKLALMQPVRREQGFWGNALRLALRGSPRYLVYGVAAQLYFALPEAIPNHVNSDTLAELGQFLPVRFKENEREERMWWGLRSDVLKSWRVFLRTHFA